MLGYNRQGTSEGSGPGPPSQKQDEGMKIGLSQNEDGQKQVPNPPM